MQTDSFMHGKLLRILLELGLSTHRIGFKELCIAIPRYIEDEQQTISKEILPYVAKTLGCTDWRAVEHAIRCVIVSAWKRRNVAVWSKYFPCSKKAPSTKLFIATIAEFVK